MTCKHLQQLYDVCERNGLKLSSAELVRIVCPQCGSGEVCPSVLFEHYEAKHPVRETSEPESVSGQQDGP